MFWLYTALWSAPGIISADMIANLVRFHKVFCGFTGLLPDQPSQSTLQAVLWFATTKPCIAKRSTILGSHLLVYFAPHLSCCGFYHFPVGFWWACPVTFLQSSSRRFPNPTQPLGTFLFPVRNIWWRYFKVPSGLLSFSPRAFPAPPSFFCFPCLASLNWPNYTRKSCFLTFLG